MTRLAYLVALVATLAFVGTAPARASDPVESLGDPITASSTSTSGGCWPDRCNPSQANDSTTSTRWSSAYSDHQWIQIDLNRDYRLSEVKLNWEKAYASAYQVQVSADGAHWTTVYSTTSGDGGIDDITGIDAVGRYVRMYGSARATNYGYSLWDFSVFGDNPSSAAAPTRATTSIASVDDPQEFVDTNGDGGNTMSVDFSGSNAAHFECSLVDADHPAPGTWVPCTSPWTFWAALGNDSVRVRAVDSNGVPDASGAWRRFAVSPASRAPASAAPAPRTAPAPPSPARGAALGASRTRSAGGTSGRCSGQTLFCDDFSGRAGAAPATSKWIKRGNNVCDTGGGIKNANAFQDGRGHLIMRVKREPRSLCGVPFSSSFIGTFNYGSGWPPTRVQAAFTVPFHIQMRALMPDSPGMWAALWPMSVDREPSQQYYELDVAEARMTFPTSAGCHTHVWPSNSNTWDGGVTVANMATHWHTYAATVYKTHVNYWVDGRRCGRAPSWRVAPGRYGILIDNIIPTGRADSWGAGNGWPRASDPGPWDLKVDYIKVTRPRARG